ncbi:uncharacterized protein TEOVI_000266100 [Trypanosoma equiperdum]|uniref:Transmembrane protein n=2 Tax=Trypanozoon TaxID=39700 RepID=Q580B4_TRYB2|nr:hypothetical protein, conserved [Trypanosoma brucei brucei TREU927]AAX80933.1 hypothetical protein, conserved [Trypanosoma brucei]AAZ10677.1 hypothetical protein, conserved [Trypanosoma brucei brucei TREU927]SCU71081.1 hypothetical protein, conserved [Trypanosoma equiperdum]
MGHTEHRAAFNRREVVELQQRLTSFLLIFTAVAIAFVVLVASMQTRVATCQTQASMAIHSMYGRFGSNNSTVLDTIVASLGISGVRVVPVEVAASHQAIKLDVFDTSQATLQSAGFRLARQSGLASVVLWKLLYIDHSLCDPERTISMEALPNVDYEKASYRVKAITVDNTRLFLYETNVATKDKDRITTFSQLQSVFPGFNSKVGTPHMILTKSLSIEPEFVAELYRGSTSLSVELRVEKIQQVDNHTPIWRILVVARSPQAEQNFHRVHKVVANALAGVGALCNKEGCGTSIVDEFFL